MAILNRPPMCGRPGRPARPAREIVTDQAPSRSARLSAFQAAGQHVSIPRSGDPAGISTLREACRDGDKSRAILSATVRMCDRARDESGWRGPAASVARIVRLAASQRFQHGGRAEDHGGPPESERLGRSRLRCVAIGRIAGDDQPLRLPWPSVALRPSSVLKICWIAAAQAPPASHGSDGQPARRATPRHCKNAESRAQPPVPGR